MTSGFEILEHTADLKLRAWGGSLEGLFRSAAEGFYYVIGDLVLTGESQAVSIELEAPDATDLFHDWLAELLFRFDARRVQLAAMQFDRIDDHRLVVRAQQRRIDPARSRFNAEVKAVTYHGLAVEERQGRYEATVILDL
jgi:SHS2 domain-containing protein